MTRRYYRAGDALSLRGSIQRRCGLAISMEAVTFRCEPGKDAFSASAKVPIVGS